MTKLTDNVEKERVWVQIVAILIVSLGSTSMGIFILWPTPSIPILVNEGISMEQASYLSVFPSIALVIFSPISGILLDKMGRKQSLFSIAIPQIISWILIANYNSIYMLYTARFFSGIADAGVFVAGPTYIAEISTPAVRGTWGIAFSLFGYIGNLLVTVVGSYFSIEETAMILSVIPILLLIGIFFLPETPYYLIMQNDSIAARESLKRFRQKTDVEDELIQLTKDVHRQMSESGTVKDLYRIASNRNALITAAFLRGAQQFAGISAISVYSRFIFGQTELFSSAESTIVFMSLLVVANFISAMVMDKMGRKKSMVISCLGCGILLIIQSIYFYLNDNTEVDVSNLNLIPIIGLCLYILFYAIGVGIMPTLMLGELFSSSVKEKSLCVTNIMFGIYVAVATKLFQLMMSSIGIYFAFAFFAMCCFINAFASCYFVPNTQGKTLEEIQQSFKMEEKK